ncbi:unnamed protein product [Trifolium pratense]|uniref:Uncharacterized protein n=1 Tax=Trifolium pratense TaxID=57577 RepID=A0ACB0JBK3_TRIPR|nr:unnamed protein product [Trifolium pratense]
MNKAHFEFFFILVILLASKMVVQTEGWSCNPIQCALACVRKGCMGGGLCLGFIFKSCVCNGQKINI